MKILETLSSLLEDLWCRTGNFPKIIIEVESLEDIKKVLTDEINKTTGKSFRSIECFYNKNSCLFSEQECGNIAIVEKNGNKKRK